jgi:hypothetical protein
MSLHFPQCFCCSSTEEIDYRHRFIAIEAGNPARNADSLSKRPGNKSASHFPCYPWTVVWEKGFTGCIHRINRSGAFLRKLARKATFQIHHTEKTGISSRGTPIRMLLSPSNDLPGSLIPYDVFGIQSMLRNLGEGMETFVSDNPIPVLGKAGSFNRRGTLPSRCHHSNSR